MSKPTQMRKRKMSPPGKDEKENPEESIRSCESSRVNTNTSLQDDSRASRLIKKAVYKRQKEEKKFIPYGDQGSKIKNGSGFVSGKTRKHRSDKIKDKNFTERKSAERIPSKSLKTSVLTLDPQEKKRSKDSLGQHSSQRRASKFKRLESEPSSSATKRETVVQKKSSTKESRKNENRSLRALEQETSVRKKSLPEEPQKNKSTRSSTDTQKSHSFDDPPKQKSEKFRNISKSSKVTAFEAERFCSEIKDKKSSFSSTPSTSEESESVSSHSRSGATATFETLHSLSILQTYSQKFVPFKFKIPKKVRPTPVVGPPKSNKNIDAVSTITDHKKENEAERSENVMYKVEEMTEANGYFLSETTKFQSECEVATLPGTSAAAITETQPQYGQMQVVEQLNLTRYEERLEVQQSYGELTCMDVDSPEEGPAESNSIQLDRDNLLLVLDTNILLSHLDYVKKIVYNHQGAFGNPVILIPWVVLQELDSLKKGRGSSDSVAHLATPAISYIYNALKKGEPRVWGQSLQQASESNYSLNAENNDDRVLQCCLQHKNLYPECSLILCTNDKNLCSKALLSGVKALCKTDLEADFKRSGLGLPNLQNERQPPVQLPINPQISSAGLLSSSAATQPHSSQGILSKRVTGKDKNVNLKVGPHDYLKTYFNELENCLVPVLSDVLESEMKAAYQDLWSEIIYEKPPWYLQSVLGCLKKHWIAVFGNLAPRGNLDLVQNLINFHTTGKKLSHDILCKIIRESKDLVEAFWKSSKRAPPAVSLMEKLLDKLQTQPSVSTQVHSLDGDVDMNDDGDNEDEVSPKMSHEQMWMLFENVWSKLYQTSLEVFKALGFDPDAVHGPPAALVAVPPQDTLDCLHNLSSVISQLLQAFSSVLSSSAGLKEVEALLNVLRANKIIEDVGLTAKDLRDCFSQPDYREKLYVGGNQLVSLEGALERCAGAFKPMMSSNQSTL